MKFCYYNPVEEKGGCVARALSKAYQLDYNQVKEELIKLSQELNYDDYRELEVFESYMLFRGASILSGWENLCIKDANFDNNTYVVFAYKDDFYHLLCICDNIVFDKREDVLDLIVLKVYKI